MLDLETTQIERADVRKSSLTYDTLESLNVQCKSESKPVPICFSKICVIGGE